MLYSPVWRCKRQSKSAAVERAVAQVPSLINYQGRLLDNLGNPVTGNVDITVGVYTNQVGGTQVYQEIVGTVPVVDGIYSFNWGQDGTSVVTATEQLGVSDGVTTVYNYTVRNPPILNPSVTIDDGNFSWNDVTGSSSSGNFIGTVSDYATGTVSAVYLSGASASGTGINVQYSHETTSILSSLAWIKDAWMQVSVDGSPLMPRDRLVSVPYP